MGPLVESCWMEFRLLLCQTTDRDGFAFFWGFFLFGISSLKKYTGQLWLTVWRLYPHIFELFTAKCINWLRNCKNTRSSASSQTFSRLVLFISWCVSPLNSIECHPVLQNKLHNYVYSSFVERRLRQCHHPFIFSHTSSPVLGEPCSACDGMFSNVILKDVTTGNSTWGWGWVVGGVKKRKTTQWPNVERTAWSHTLEEGEKKEDATIGGLDGGVVWLTTWQTPSGQRQGKPSKLSFLNPITALRSLCRKNSWMIHKRKWRRYAPFLLRYTLKFCPHSLPTTTLCPQVGEKKPRTAERSESYKIMPELGISPVSHTYVFDTRPSELCGRPSSGVCSEKNGGGARFGLRRHTSRQKQPHRCVYRGSCGVSWV